MEPFFQDFLTILDALHTDFKSALHDLPQEGLLWNPGPETNSLAVLAVHTAGSERYWVGDVVAQESSNRDREAEFSILEANTSDLETRLDASYAYIQGVLEKLTLSDLSTDRFSIRHGRTFSCGWALLHTLEHAAQHVAHAQLTRQLWDQSQS